MTIPRETSARFVRAANDAARNAVTKPSPERLFRLFEAFEDVLDELHADEKTMRGIKTVLRQLSRQLEPVTALPGQEAD